MADQSEPPKTSPSSDIVSRATSEASGGVWRTYGPLIGLQLATIAVYGISLTFDFVWDDRNLIVLNPYLQQPDTLWRAFTADFWRFTNNSHLSGFYRPLVLATYWVEYQLWGLQPAGYHAVNLGLHLISLSLIWGLARRLGWRLRGALVSAAFFALHPVQHAALGNIASRTDLLATTFLLSGLLLWLKTDRWRYGGLALLWLALLAKEVAVVGPILALGAGFLLPESERPRRWVRWLPLSVWIAYGPLRLAVLGLGSAVGTDFAQTVWRGGSWLLFYAVRIVIPLPQPPIVELADPGLPLILASLVVWVASTVLACSPRLAPRYRFALVWFLLSMLPVSELLPLGTRFSDLMLYLPLVSVALAVGAVYERVSDKRWVRPLVAVAMTLMAVASFRSVLVWESNLTLWRHGIALDARHPAMNMNYANALRRANKTVEGCAHLQKTLPLMRNSPSIQYNLGNCEREQKRPAEAAQYYREALRLSHGSLIQARYNLVVTLLAVGEREEALLEGKRLVKQAPDVASHWEILGVVQAQRQKFPEAVEAFERSLELRPSDTTVQRMLHDARRLAREGTKNGATRSD